MLLEYRSVNIYEELRFTSKGHLCKHPKQEPGASCAVSSQMELSSSGGYMREFNWTGLVKRRSCQRSYGGQGGAESKLASAITASGVGKDMLHLGLRSGRFL